ncbi:unnamed protein product [Vicia faba]|uniref:Uncharacterized protein n=1 Tax=Vicia faba TaxID=3906 RepID=A0AAV1AZ85_VICFA|nr:unnamed protein product [Vicia faba]
MESVTAAIESAGIGRAASTPPFDKLPFLGTGPSYRSMGTSIDSAIGKVRHGITLRSSTRLDRGKFTYSCSSQVESVSFGSRLRFNRERFGTSSISWYERLVLFEFKIFGSLLLLFVILVFSLGLSLAPGRLAHRAYGLAN